jgi:glycosyltransferase involved in cell wall biosynthesis
MPRDNTEQRSSTVVNFFYPHRQPSGVSALFGRMASVLSRSSVLRPRLIDYPQGFMVRCLRESSGVKLTEFSRHRLLPIGSDEVLVLQAQIPSKISRQLSPCSDTRLIFWQLHPFNLIPPLIPLLSPGLVFRGKPDRYLRWLGTLQPRILEGVKSFIDLANRKRSLFFYDQPALTTTEAYLGYRLENPILLPVPISVPERPARSAKISKEHLHVGWVGRLYDFKIHILLHVIQKFADYAQREHRGVTFHVIGGGPEEKRLNSIASKQRYFELRRFPDMTWNTMSDYLTAEIDIVAAMGTSALEGAALGLPVIVLDFAYSSINPEYRFRWLYETKGYDLGHIIAESDCVDGCGSLPALLAELDANYSRISENTFKYCKTNHDLEVIGQRFIELIELASLRHGDLSPAMLKKTFIRRIYERVRY